MLIRCRCQQINHDRFSLELSSKGSDLRGEGDAYSPRGWGWGEYYDGEQQQHLPALSLSPPKPTTNKQTDKQTDAQNKQTDMQTHISKQINNNINLQCRNHLPLISSSLCPHGILHHCRRRPTVPHPIAANPC